MVYEVLKPHRLCFFPSPVTLLLSPCSLPSSHWSSLVTSSMWPSCLPLGALPGFCPEGDALPRLAPPNPGSCRPLPAPAKALGLGSVAPHVGRPPSPHSLALPAPPPSLLHRPFHRLITISAFPTRLSAPGEQSLGQSYLSLNPQHPGRGQHIAGFPWENPHHRGSTLPAENSPTRF